MRLKRISIITCTLLALVGFRLLQQSKLWAAQESSPELTRDSMVEQTLRSYHNSEFEDAISTANRIRSDFPTDPAGAFALLGSYQTIMRNYRTRIYEAQFDSLLSLSIDLAKSGVKRDKRDSWNYFYLGCFYGSRSIFYAQRGKWLAAFRDGSKVLNSFNKAVDYDPEFYDSHYGIGLYKYWLGAAKNKVMGFLPFAKDTRQEGLEQMKLATEKAKFLKVDAMYALSAAYYNERDYEKSLELSDKLYRLYPTNASLLYRRGRTYQELGEWQMAEESFHELLSVLKITPYQSVSYQIECLFQIAKCRYEQGDYFQTQKYCQDAMILEKYCDFSNEIDGPLEQFSDIKKALQKLNDKVKSILVVQVKDDMNE